MRRIRIGLTGLASIFLLVLLGAAIFRMFSDETGPRNAAVNEANAAAKQEDASEPLAELGVTPGGD